MTNTPYQAAVNFLSRREHAAAELAQKLRKKGYATSEIQQTLTELQNDDLQSDKRYATFCVMNSISLGWGPMYVRQKLMHQQIDKNIIEAVLDPQNDMWQQALRISWRKHNGGHLPDNDDERMKLSRYLSYRGFSEQMFEKMVMEPA